MAEAMDGRSEARLRASNRRQTREDEILDWWRDYRAKPCSGSRGLEVRDKSDGSNSYGVIPWDVPLRSERVEAECEQPKPEAVHQRYEYRQFPSRRSRELYRRRNRKG